MGVENMMNVEDFGEPLFFAQRRRRQAPASQPNSWSVLKNALIPPAQ